MSTKESPARLQSLDALRGFDMLFIMGFAALVISICSLWPDSTVAQWIAGQMEHVEWHGLRHHDTIFPLFLFLAGVSFPFSMASSMAKGRTRQQIAWKAVRRGLILVFLGMVYNGFFRLDFSSLRCASVLGRIGLAWMLAALLYLWCKPRTSALFAVIILIGYWLVMWLVPGSADPYSLQDNLVGIVDRALLPGRLLYGNPAMGLESGWFDPEGLLSTIPAIATALFGMLTGSFVRLPEETVAGGKKALWMAVAGVGFTAVGYAWNMVFPINKMLWTSSFVCVLAGYSLLLFALFYWLIDVKGWRKWAFPLRVIGMNSITIYLAQRIIDFHGIARFFFGGAASFCDAPWSEIILLAAYLIVSWLFLFFLYRKRVFLKV